MAHEYETTRRVEFADTDVAGIVHFSNFFRYMEAVEHEFFRSLGLSVHGQLETREGGVYGWARAHASCDYTRPAHYQDLLAIRLTVVDRTERSFRYAFSFRVLDEGDGSGEPVPGPEIARGELGTIYVSKDHGGERLRSSAMPDEVARLVEVAPSTS
jgi:YbgC/YbaW family acyl-CoA thioester hydrolase